MKRRRKKERGFGGTILRLVLVLALAAGAWFAWAKYRGTPVDLPDWASLEKIGDIASRSKQTTSPGITATNPPPVIPPAAPLTNPAPIVETNAPPTVQPQRPKKQPERAVRSVLEAQIALSRMGISVGCIDGQYGNNMRRALLAWQIHNNLPVSGELDQESKDALLIQEPLFIPYVVTSQDLERLGKVPAGWLDKSRAKALDYETILELVAEKGRATERFVRSLNPEVNWSNVVAGTVVQIPWVDPPAVREKAAFVRVHLYSKTLDVFGRSTNLLAHYPCSIAAKVDKRPVGELSVANAASNPTYLFNPEIFKESAEARQIGRKLVIPAGPNNPVGTAWLGLSKSGYGIHGTPKPEQIGRTESHGCFRLANWNAEHLLQLAWVGMPVFVEK